MKRPMFLVFGLVAAVLCCALALAALARPSALIGSLLFTITLGLLCTATAMSFVSNGTRRVFWIGFVAFGWPHFGLAFPWNQTDGVNPPRLLSETLFLALGPFGEGFDRFTQFDLGYYLPVGQCLATMAFAFCGAMLLRFIACRVPQ